MLKFSCSTYDRKKSPFLKQQNCKVLSSLLEFKAPTWYPNTRFGKSCDKKATREDTNKLAKSLDLANVKNEIEELDDSKTLTQ